MRPPARLCAIIGLAAALIAPTAARAACTVSSAGVAFGAYDPLSGTPDDSIGTVSSTCTILDPAPEVEIGAGNSGTFTTRRMSNGGSNLNYNLYTNAGRTIVWGNGSGGTGTVTMSGGTPVLFFWRTYSATIYGRIPAGQNVTAGSYADTLIIQVNF